VIFGHPVRGLVDRVVAATQRRSRSGGEISSRSVIRCSACDTRARTHSISSSRSLTSSAAYLVSSRRSEASSTAAQGVPPLPRGCLGAPCGCSAPRRLRAPSRADAGRSRPIAHRDPVHVSAGLPAFPDRAATAYCPRLSDDCSPSVRCMPSVAVALLVQSERVVDRTTLALTLRHRRRSGVDRDDVAGPGFRSRLAGSV
jgi:hypothetical protein